MTKPVNPDDLKGRTIAALKPAANALKAMQTRIDEWQALGGVKAASDQAKQASAEFRTTADNLQRLAQDLEHAGIDAQREEVQRFFRIFQQVAKRSDLHFEGQMVTDAGKTTIARVGPYEIEIRAGRGVQVSFAADVLGTIRELEDEKALSQFQDIRRTTEIESKDFIKHLDRAYEAATSGGKRDARLGDVLKRFIFELQPNSFWVDAVPKTLKPYTHANFAWEILREIQRGTLHFKFASANVHSNIAAAGQKPRDGSLVLLLEPNGPSRLYSTITRTPKPE